jgi:DNA-binding transcriptional MerR regulator
MRVPINKITKELEIKSFQLHKWEERGWLGTEPVLKDPDNNGQRIYSKQQVEHIEFINEVIKDQKKRGIHRTDPKEMEKLLLEKFGGEVTRMESEELVVLPTTIESFQGLLIQQNKDMNALREMVDELIKGQLELKSYIEKSLPGRVQLEEHDRELLLSLKETMTSRKKELDIAEVAVTEDEEKPGFFARLFKKK